MRVTKQRPIWKPVINKKFRIVDGKLFDDQGEFRIQEHEILRSVGSDGYTSNFSLQWNKFSKIQLDQLHDGEDLSKNRLKKVTQWNFDKLHSQDILEAGCGAGRFSRVILDNSKAHLFSFDYSESVRVNYLNNGPRKGFYLFQSDIYDLPFEDYQFDKVFCFGMLQHTPDPKRTMECLADMTKPGGELIVDFYPCKGWYTKIHAKYLLLPFTHKIDHQKLLHWIENNIDGLLQLYKGLHSLKLGIFTRFLPLVDIYKVLPSGLSAEQEKEWAILDTFDMLSPQYDKPQKMEDVKRWMVESGLNISFAGNIEYDEKHIVSVVKGIRPCAG